MHDLKSNFDKFHLLTKEFSPMTSIKMAMFETTAIKLSDSSIISLAICMEALSIDSENLLWHKLRTDYSDHFPDFPHRTRFNLRRKRPNAWIEKLNRQMATRLAESENVFVVDSMPVPVCKNARESRLRICKEHFETAPDKGYSAVNKSYFVGYKLHLLTTFTRICFCMDLSKASVHDLHYLKDVKYSRLNNCTLLGRCRIHWFTAANGLVRLIQHQTGSSVQVKSKRLQEVPVHLQKVQKANRDVVLTALLSDGGQEELCQNFWWTGHTDHIQGDRCDRIADDKLQKWKTSKPHQTCTGCLRVQPLNGLVLLATTKPVRNTLRDTAHSQTVI